DGTQRGRSISSTAMPSPPFSQGTPAGPRSAPRLSAMIRDSRHYIVIWRTNQSFFRSPIKLKKQAAQAVRARGENIGKPDGKAAAGEMPDLSLKFAGTAVTGWGDAPSRCCCRRLAR